MNAVQLLAARRDKLAHEKLRIGALCSSLLESPEKKVFIIFILSYENFITILHTRRELWLLVNQGYHYLLGTMYFQLKNLFPILYLMEERLKDGALNLQSVRKLASLSACEVFRDILPDYTLRHQDYSDVKCMFQTATCVTSSFKLMW